MDYTQEQLNENRKALKEDRIEDITLNARILKREIPHVYFRVARGQEVK